MFEFASGKLDVLEKRIFNKLDQERMLKAPDYKSSFEILYDTDMGEAAVKTKNTEEIIEQNLTDLKNLFLKILEDKKIILFLFLRFDLSNVKLAFKKKIQTEINIPYIPWATESGQKIEQWLQALSVRKQTDDAEKSPLNPFIKKLMLRTNDYLKKTKNASSSRAIEIAADKAYFEIKAGLAEKIHPFLKDIAQREKNRENINLLSEIIFNKARETSCGAEKVLAFFQKKMNACHNIRLILFAKLNNIKISEIEGGLLPL